MDHVMAIIIIVCPIFTKASDRFVRFVSNQGQKEYCQYNLSYCSDFRNESNGIFVLGVVFLFRQISNFY